MKALSRLVENLAPSQTVTIDNRARELKASGIDIISLGAGEPDFDTPTEIAKAGIAAIENKLTHYTAPAGIPVLKQAVCDRLKSDHSLDYHPRQVIVTSGAKHAIYNSLMCLLNPGDEVLIPTPCWVTYPEMVHLMQAQPVLVPGNAENAYKVSAKDLQEKITEKTKLLILNSPCNPTGAVYSRQELTEIAEVVVKHDLYCISDEIYEHLVYDGTEHISIASTHPEMPDRTILVNGVSKAWAMTGWRIGYAVCPEDIAKLMVSFQGQSTHHPSNIAQAAATAALKGSLNSVFEMRDVFVTRRNQACEMLETLDQLRMSKPAGAFYLFPDVTAWLGCKTKTGKIIETDLDLCTWLLDEWHLAIIPGSAFLQPGCVRLAFTTDTDELRSGVQRLIDALNSLN